MHRFPQRAQVPSGRTPRLGTATIDIGSNSCGIALDCRTPSSRVNPEFGSAIRNLALSVSRGQTPSITSTCASRIVRTPAAEPAGLVPGTDVAIEGLRQGYGRRQVLFDITCTFEPGITALIGLNGAGKTTLIRSLVGDLRPWSGSIRLGEVAMVDGWGRAQLAAIGYLPQDPRMPGHMREVCGDASPWPAPSSLSLSSFSLTNRRSASIPSNAQVCATSFMPPPKTAPWFSAPMSSAKWTSSTPPSPSSTRV